MASKKHWNIFFSISIILLIPISSYCQVEDSLSNNKNSFGAKIEKILKEVNAVYQNEKKRALISSAEKLNAEEISKDEEVLDNNIAEYSTDHWQHDKVNPYRDVVLSTPFRIEFNQTTFTPPIENDMVITSRFGRRRRGPHRGIDIDLVTGDKVRSVLPGKVRFVGYSRGHGKTIVVRHANDIETVYAHLSAYSVNVNDLVAEGQTLGLGGNTGNSRGSHLHLEVRYKGVCIHPEYVFNFDGSNAIRGTELWVTNGWRSARSHSSYRKSKVTPLNNQQDAIVSQNNEPRYHRVRKGDTLSHIAVKHGLSVRRICKLNGISQKSTLRIGQNIRIR